MTDIETAVKHLNGHSICLCKDGKYIIDNGKGISPMMKFIDEGRDLSGYSAADLIVGKAAAILFVKAGIISVYGSVMSKAAKSFLEKNNIPCKYHILTDRIINRSGTDICPMEKTVANIEEAEKGYIALRKRLSELKKS